MTPGTTWSVFTKPWPTLAAPELASVVHAMGLTAVELPVRPGCAVEPEHAADALPRYAAELAEHGVVISSVAADPTEAVLAGCRAAGVDLVRMMARIDGDHRAGIATWHRRLDALVEPVARYGVAVGLQPHEGPYVPTALAMMELLDPLPSKGFGLVWDAGHEGLGGDDPRRSIDAAYERILQVNLKNARWVPTDLTDAAGQPRRRPEWVAGGEGSCDWGVVLHHLARHGYGGPFCLPAEYSAEQADVSRLVRDDHALARSLFH
ncbi:sugar phosphate isomerase/epimerase family protein [Propionibacteriaceae bacterium Y2011]